MKVYVGMSGGVDSSLTAALLVEQGHDVTGVYMKNWTEDLPGMRCPWADDLADAKRVAVQLGIPLRVYDFQAEYKQKVVDYMLAEYQAGRTPNPDIMCNQEVKFKIFLETALADGADMIATGHYAYVEDGQLRIPADASKDQTYFLYRVTREALLKTLFPLGGILKSKVREMAAERGLATATKRDSQGICFVGSVGIKDFLGHYVTAESGDILDADGKVVGRHDGAIFYTIGQRHGLGVGGGLPYYVVGKDMAKNEVYVSRDINSESLWVTTLRLDHTHWIGEQSPAEGAAVMVRLRHRGPLLAAHAYDAGARIELVDSERSSPAGQSVVLYDDGVCLGGGIVSL